MKHRNLILSCLIVAFIILVYVFGGQIADRVFTKTDAREIIAALSDGNYTSVRILDHTKGLYLSGGHGWSLGSEKHSYEMVFTDDGNIVRWQGPGLPITLQSEGSSYYLATFDRETNWNRPDFRCYVWNGDWREIQTKIFPKNLAVNNLMTLGSTAPVFFESREFRSSLLAHFWFCIDSGLPAWEVSKSTMDTDFVIRFRQAAKK